MCYICKCKIKTKDMEEFLKKHNLTERQFYGLDVIEDSLYLDNLKSIPEGFNPTVEKDLNLDSLTSVSKGFSPTVGGNLFFGEPVP